MKTALLFITLFVGDIGSVGVVTKATNDAIQLKGLDGELHEYPYTKDVEVYIDENKVTVKDIRVGDKAIALLTRSMGGPWEVYKVRIVRLHKEKTHATSYP